MCTITALHPKLKLKYFQKKGWPQLWIKTVCEMLEEEFKKYKGAHETSVHATSDIYYLFN